MSAAYKKVNDAMLAAFLAVPERPEDLATLTTEQIQGLRVIGNCIDNLLYMEIKRREPKPAHGKQS